MMQKEVWIQSEVNKLYGKLWHVNDARPVIIMLPGLGFYSFEYETIARLLSQSGFNCLALDYRGHGRSQGKRGFWTLQDLTNDTICAVDYISHRFSGKIYIFGNSLGAMVGVYATAQDKRIAGLAASNCPDRLALFLLTPVRKILFVLAKIAATILPLRVSVNHFYSYSQLIDDPKWIKTFTNDSLITNARRLSIKAYKSFLQEWNGTAAIQKVHAPVLIMQGKNDHMQPPTEADKLFAVANEPKQKELVNTGHLPHVEKPELVAKILADWFESDFTSSV